MISSGDIVNTHLVYNSCGYAVLLHIEEFLSQVSVVLGIAGDNDSVALVDELDRLLATGIHINPVVVQNELRSAGLVCVREGNHRSTVESAIVPTGVLVGLSGLCTSGNSINSDLAQSIASAVYDCGQTGVSLNMIDQFKQFLLGVGTGSIDVLSAEISLAETAQYVENIGIDAVVHGAGYAIDQLVEIDAARQNAAQFLKDANTLVSGSHGEGALAGNALTAQTLRTVGNLRYEEQRAIGNNKFVLITETGVAIINQCLEQRVAGVRLFVNLLENLLNYREQPLALTVADCSVVQLSGTTIQFDQFVAQDFLRIILCVILYAVAVSIQSKAYGFIVCHYILPPIHYLQRTVTICLPAEV